MNDLMFSDSLQDKLNFEQDFGFIHVTFGNITGKLRSIVDNQLESRLKVDISVTDIMSAFSLIQKEYPDYVIIRYEDKEIKFNLKVFSFSVMPENSEIILTIEGAYVQ